MRCEPRTPRHPRILHFSCGAIAGRHSQAKHVCVYIQQKHSRIGGLPYVHWLWLPLFSGACARLDCRKRSSSPSSSSHVTLPRHRQAARRQPVRSARGEGGDLIDSLEEAVGPDRLPMLMAPPADARARRRGPADWNISELSDGRISRVFSALLRRRAISDFVPTFASRKSMCTVDGEETRALYWLVVSEHFFGEKVPL